MKELKVKVHTWLVTGAAGFIGGHLVETLLNNGQRVVGLDNFITGYRSNLEQIKAAVGDVNWSNFKFIEGDVTKLEDCQKGMYWNNKSDQIVPKDQKIKVDFVLHQAALGSVPRSFAEPLESSKVNIGGFVNVLEAMKLTSVNVIVYASSSAVYGDSPALPKREDKTGSALSPYAATKKANEVYANVYAGTYGFQCTGLRYFNVFGPRQDPYGAYAAVIPKWFKKLVAGEDIDIFGDGLTSRDFCYISNVVEANILAALESQKRVIDEKSGNAHVYNIAVGDRTTLNELLRIMMEVAGKYTRCTSAINFKDFRPGDVQHSLADIGLAKNELNFLPKVCVRDGLLITGRYFCENG